MSHYEDLKIELSSIRFKQAVAVLTPAVFLGLISLLALENSTVARLAAITSLMIFPLILHPLLRKILPHYRKRSDHASRICTEMASLREQIAKIYGGYRVRQKGEHFKKVYNLVGRTVRDLEEALSVGMFRERREVFVTAFMRKGVAIRITASIGSPFRCSASDNPNRWRDHIARLKCDEIRQYHNHPVHNGITGPSSVDIKTTQAICRILGADSSKLRSLIICWNKVQEWKVFEYDQNGRSALLYQFDASLPLE